MTRAKVLIVASALAAIGAPTPAAAQDPTAANDAPPARFAIIVGVNQGVDGDARSLRYADDDAAAYLELFRALGARTYVLSRFDEGTRRLHPQAVAEALDPRHREFESLIAQVSADVVLARKRGVPTVVYFIYAGHGGVEDGRGYLMLEDARLFGVDLERLVVDRVNATETHFIVDACYSVFLALSRGPGGERREARGFSSLGGLAGRSGVGLLLSTSSARESHEWSEFQSGVFSHEVRSGLLGAADADGDGRVTYREIAAFVQRANSSIPNERFRPDVYARQPLAGQTLLDLRAGLARRLELDGEHPGHYFIEDTRGVRLADFNKARGQLLHVIRLAAAGPLYLHRLDDQPDGREVEYLLEPAPAVLRLEDLQAQPSTTAVRGAAQNAFRLLFSLPFSKQNVDAFTVAQPQLAVAGPSDRSSSLFPRKPLAFSFLAVGAAAAAGGTWAVLSARNAQGRDVVNQAEAYQVNQRINGRNDWARVLYGVSGAAAVTGTLMLLWPRLLGPSSSDDLALGVVPGDAGGPLFSGAGHF